MPTKKVANLDELFADRIQANVDARKVVPFEMFGQEWHATDGQSVVAIMDAVGDESGQGFIELCVSFLVDEEREAFHAALKRPGIDAEILLEILNRLTELVADGRPTEPSAASSRTSRTTRRAGASKAS